MRQILWTLKILFGWDFSLAHYVNDATGGHSERGCPCCRGLVFMSSRKPLPSSTAPQVLTASSPAQQAENEAKASSSVLINESEPTTNIQIRLADGGRLVQKFNHSHRYLCGGSRACSVFPTCRPLVRPRQRLWGQGASRLQACSPGPPGSHCTALLTCKVGIQILGFQANKYFVQGKSKC